MQQNLKTICSRLLEIRKALGFKQKEFSKELEISQSSYCDIESGNMKPRFELLFNLSLKFDVNLRYVFHGEGGMFEKKENAFNLDSEPFTRNWEWVVRFLEYFEKSPIFMHDMMSFYYKYMLENGSVVDQDVLRSESQNRKEKKK